MPDALSYPANPYSLFVDLRATRYKIQLRAAVVYSNVFNDQRALQVPRPTPESHHITFKRPRGLLPYHNPLLSYPLACSRMSVSSSKRLTYYDAYAS